MRKSRWIRRAAAGRGPTVRAHMRRVLSERAGLSLQGAPPELLQALDRVHGQVVRAVIMDETPRVDVGALLAAELRALIRAAATRKEGGHA